MDRTDQQGAVVYFTGRRHGIFESFAQRVHWALNGMVAGYLSDEMVRDGEDLLINGRRIPAITLDEFRTLSRTIPALVVHFCNTLDELWGLEALHVTPNVRVVDFLTVLERMDLPHTYDSVTRERDWWRAQSDATIESYADRFEDSRSRRTLRARVEASRQVDRKPLMQVAFDSAFEYFNARDPRASLVPSEQEIFVDVGAAQGDTVEKFLRTVNGQYSRIYAFEPTQGQYEALAEYGRVPGITTFNAAAGARTEAIPFFVNESIPFGSNALSLGDSGGTTVQVACLRLDDAIPCATMIKMDVEGYECAVLDGAQGLIADQAPDLAVTCYHYPGDLFAIMDKVGSIHEYRHVALRHFGPSLYDSVLLFSDRQRFDSVQ